MSAYKEIKTVFRNGMSLMKALEDLGIKFECVDPKVNSVTLKTSWGSHWGGADQQVAIAISRENATRAGLGDFDGLGFRWNGTGYDLVQDHYDENNDRIKAKLAAVTQAYAKHEVRRQAKMRGYGVQEVAQGDGSIRLVLSKR